MCVKELVSIIPSMPSCVCVQNGVNAASLAVAEQYVQAFSQLAKKSNTILLPEKTGDIGAMVAQVLRLWVWLGVWSHIACILGCGCIWSRDF